MAEHNRTKDLDNLSKEILTHLQEKEVSLGNLVKETSRIYGIEDVKVVRLINTLRNQGFLEIIDPDPPKRFLYFLFSSRSTWFWTIIILIVLTLATISISQVHSFFSVTRIVTGSLFIMYLPGATLIELLYPRRNDLKTLERLALSIGLSLALVPLIGLILNYTPWGIRLVPITISLTLLTTVLALGAVSRKHSYHLLAFGRGVEKHE